jgi:signal transduction histidine kinase
MGGYLLLAQREDGIPERVAERLHQVEKIVARAGDLTRGLKTFAKGGEPDRTLVVLPELIRETAVLAMHGNETGLELDCRLPDNLGLVEADRSQLGQVLHNIILNAVQVLPAGGRITIEARNLVPGDDPAVREGQHWVKVKISDNGPGMSPAVLARVFDPFFTTKEKGTGLGLATSYAIVEKHGGRLRVESTEGRGTTFFILLPAAPPRALAGDKPPGRATAPLPFAEQPATLPA